MCNFPDCHQPVAEGNPNGMCLDHVRVTVLGSYVPDRHVEAQEQ